MVRNKELDPSMILCGELSYTQLSLHFFPPFSLFLARQIKILEKKNILECSKGTERNGDSKSWQNLSGSHRCPVM